MAESTGVKTGNELLDVIMCPICLEPLEKPKMLPCQHVCCLECLRRYVESSGHHQFYCPECRHNVSVPVRGVTAFPDAFLINKLRDIHERSLNKADCHSCHSAEVVEFCKDCQLRVCKPCLGTHLRHDRVSVACGSATTPAYPEASSFCELHNQEKVTIYCDTCSQDICNCCVRKTGKHFQHCYRTLEDYIQNSRQTMYTISERTSERIVALRHFRDERVQAVKKMQENEEGGLALFLETAHAINDAHSVFNTFVNNIGNIAEDDSSESLAVLTEVNNLIEDFESFRRILTTVLSKDGDLKDFPLKSQMEEMEAQLHVRMPKRRETESVSQSSRLCEFQKAVKDFMQRCQNASRKFARPPPLSTSQPIQFVKMLPNPVTTPHSVTNIAIDTRGTLFACCGGNVYKRQFVLEELNNGSWEKVGNLKLGQSKPYGIALSGFELVLSLASSRTKHCKILYHNLHTNTNSFLSVKFACQCPALAIAHDGSLLVTDSDGSNVFKIVDGEIIPLLNLRSQVKIVSVVEGPGYIFVCDRSSQDVFMMTSHGKKYQSLKAGIPEKIRADLCGPRSVVLDKMNRILVACEHSHKVLMFTGDGEFIKILLNASDHGIHSPCALAIVNNKLVVACATDIRIFKL